MAFVDSAKIHINAGRGGNGCESFYRDKFSKHPRADGGNGGDGGRIIMVADPHLQTLLDFRFNQHYKAKNGTHGSSNGKTGRTGEDCILRVPCGTVLFDEDNGMLIQDLLTPGQQVIVAKGGKGGVGNMHKKTPKPPEEGERRIIRLELKIIADVGLIGFPNAGKSTLVSAISNVKSKIANYPFTTKSPILGFVQGDVFDCVVADLPGLIEGAHLGKGLGHQFLKHAERTKILVHVIDMSGSEGRDPIYDFNQINEELDKYSMQLAHKHKIVVANKMDKPEAKANLARFKKEFSGRILVVSGLEKQGLEELKEEIFEVLGSAIK